MMGVSHPEILDLVRRALAEDIGTGDVTSEACIPADATASGYFLAREPQVVAGLELLPLMYDSVELLKASGDRVADGDTLARVNGTARRLLALERTALNFLQHLGGIATLAGQYVDRVAGTGCRVLDTRKTTPGLRRLEKMAAAAGGVTNHRMGLYDAILIKNNHITAAGGVRAALERASAYPLPVEIEVRTRAELREALDADAKHLLLDNLTPAEAREWIAEIGGRAKVELSGGITLDTIRAFAEAGPDFISSGAITHSARAVDISFRLD
jgi:nicotinate-nucleotide pyrophosphorylase (carboxylating)